MKKIITIIILVLSILSVGCSKGDYLFEKKSFKKDEITYLDWKEYRGKIRITYEFWNVSPTKNIWSTSQEEVRFIFDELKKSKEVNSSKYEGISRYAIVVVKRLEDKRNLLVFVINKNGILKIGNKYFKVTDKLWNHLLKVEKREENVSVEVETKSMPIKYNKSHDFCD
ncbi:hypothetical protein [Thermohalobacter berrensis]|uniref:Lipoprotein n=1 Tax=Thermohalobacter berrensis TaxID=99594 RepID=A0A419SWA8_9FIRM|nr:hypothetical protein [Thermohalobacter berrensis]RKD29508.1 hypothetical protein BET03_05460 [Thermohalobacter berrensis]